MAQASINNLSADVLKEGCLKCILNAQQLCDESELLHKNEMYARSYALSHFAREELAKSLMLLRVFGERSGGRSVNWKRLNKRFRDHKQKIINDRMISTMLFANQTEIKFEDFLKGIDFTNDRKNSCLYVDWEKTEFLQPSEKIDKKLSDRNLKMAIYRVAALSKLTVKIIDNVEKDPSGVIQSEMMQNYYQDPHGAYEAHQKAFNQGHLKPLSEAIHNILLAKEGE